MRTTVTRDCETCGQPFTRDPAHMGRFCSTRCSGIGRTGRYWKGDAAGDEAKRNRAQRLYRLGPCERCGQAGTERHHRDANPGNNEPENVAIVCRRCHMLTDGRMEQFIHSTRHVAGQCRDCGRECAALRKGRCYRCAWRIMAKWSRHADACRGCGTTEQRHEAHGYCKHCYSINRRAISGEIAHHAVRTVPAAPLTHRRLVPR